MLALALALGLELGLECELAAPFELFVSVAETDSVWASVPPQQQVAMAQPAGAHRLQMQGGPDWGQTAPLLEQPAVVLSH